MKIIIAIAFYAVMCTCLGISYTRLAYRQGRKNEDSSTQGLFARRAKRLASAAAVGMSETKNVLEKYKDLGR